MCEFVSHNCFSKLEVMVQRREKQEREGDEEIKFLGRRRYDTFWHSYEPTGFGSFYAFFHFVAGKYTGKGSLLQNRLQEISSRRTLECPFRAGIQDSQVSQ